MSNIGFDGVEAIPINLIVLLVMIGIGLGICVLAYAWLHGGSLRY